MELTGMFIPYRGISNPEVIPSHIRKDLLPDTIVRAGILGIENGKIEIAGLLDQRPP